MDPTARRRLGRVDLALTQFGFGTAPLSGFRDTLAEDVALATIQAAWDAGIRMFDTSPYYGYGRAELRLGTVLRDKPRDEYVLSTKIGRVMHPLGRDGTPPEGWRTGGLRFVPEFDYIVRRRAPLAGTVHAAHGHRQRGHRLHPRCGFLDHAGP